MSKNMLIMLFSFVFVVQNIHPMNRNYCKKVFSLVSFFANNTIKKSSFSIYDNINIVKGNHEKLMRQPYSAILRGAIKNKKLIPKKDLFNEIESFRNFNKKYLLTHEKALQLFTPIDSKDYYEHKKYTDKVVCIRNGYGLFSFLMINNLLAENHSGLVNIVQKAKKDKNVLKNCVVRGNDNYSTREVIHPSFDLGKINLIGVRNRLEGQIKYANFKKKLIKATKVENELEYLCEYNNEIAALALTLIDVDDAIKAIQQ